jgi:hypothetical protein
LLPVFAWFDFRGVLELLFGNVDLEAIGLFVVGQHRPGNRIVILADAEESAETQDRVFEAMSDDPDFEYLIIDSTIVRAHQHAAGAKKGGLKIRRSVARAVA